MVLAGVLEANLDRGRIVARHPLGPLDRHDAVRGQRIEAEVVHLAWRQAVEIDVIERQAAAVFLDQRERRAAHLVRVDAQTSGEAAYERRLARAQLAIQQDPGARPEPRRQRGADRLGLGIRARQDGAVSHAPR